MNRTRLLVIGLKTMRAQAARCGHGVRNDDIDQDCVICFPVDKPTVTQPEPALEG
jgi:hypothetical protein